MTDEAFKESIDVVEISTLRPKLLNLTLASFQKHFLNQFGKCRIILNIDPVGEENSSQDEILELVNRYSDNVIACTPKTGNFSLAVRWAWSQVESPYFLHLEDDWFLKKRVLKGAILEQFGFDEKLALEEAQRCLNCDMQTVFEDDLCIECDACVDICSTDCINFIDNDTEQEIRGKLRVPALNLDQSLYVSGELKTKRRMVKDEDMCVHCGLCAERCPTGAWDMKKNTYIEGHTLNNKIKVKEVA